MATVRFFVRTDMSTFDDFYFPQQVYGGGGSSQNATSFEMETNFYYHEWLGSGFALERGPSGWFPAGGTVTRWEFGVFDITTNPAVPYSFVKEHYRYWTFEGISVPAADLEHAITYSVTSLEAYMPTRLRGLPASVRRR
jgi:hypothetical protein